MGGWIALAIVVALLIWAIVIFNGLVMLKNRYLNMFKQISVVMQRRYDLIPNLVEGVKTYLAHERETLEKVIAARGAAMGAQQKAAAAPGDAAAMQGMAQAEGALGGAMGRLMAVFEAYPDLKANTTIMQVQEELTSTENKIAFSRQGYNDSVMEYNTKRESFPGNIFAAMFGFKEAALWESAELAEISKAPKVSYK